MGDSSFGDFRLNQGQKWEISHGHVDTAPVEKKNWAGKLWDVITGKASLTNIFRSISKSIQPLEVKNRKDADDAVALMDAVEKTYSKTGAFFRVLDGTLHAFSTPTDRSAQALGEPKGNKEAVLDKTYGKLKEHFFGSEKLIGRIGAGGADERAAINTVYQVLTKENPSAKDFADLEDTLSLAIGVDNQTEKTDWYTLMADKGYPAASERLMQFADQGIIKAEDGFNRPLEIYQQGAKLGFLKAQLKLEDAYRNGNSLGVEQDLTQAHSWAVKAQKDDGAWLRSAVDVASGIGVDKDPVKAAALLMGIVEHSKDPAIKADATFQLGRLAADQGVPIRAKEYYTQAKEQGSQSASLALDQLDRADALAAIKDNPKASPEALFRAANFLDQGIGGDKDTSAARTLYGRIVNTKYNEGRPGTEDLRSAELSEGDLPFIGAAGYRLGEMYENEGKFVAAATTFEKAGMAGNIPAFAKLLKLQRDGQLSKAAGSIKGKVDIWVANGWSSFVTSEAVLANAGATNSTTAKKTVSSLAQWGVKVTPDNFAVDGDVTEASVQRSFKAIDVPNQQLTTSFLDIARAQGQPITQEDLKITAKALLGKDDERSCEITALLLKGVVNPEIEDPVLKRAFNVLEVCMESIKDDLHNGTGDQQGIFRISIEQTVRDSFKQALTGKTEDGKPSKSMEDLASIINSEKNDLHYAPNIFKLTLRDLLDNQPEQSQIIPASTQQVFYQTALISDKEERNSALKELVMQMPPDKRHVLKTICGFANEIAEYKDKTSMGPSNLAIVFGPNLIRAPDGDFMAVGQINQTMVNLVENYDAIFG